MDVDAFASWMVLGLDTHHHLACSPHCCWSELSEMEAKESNNKKDTTSESPHHFVFRNKNPQS